MADITFFNDAEGYIESRASDRLRSLGLWLVNDIGSSMAGALNLLEDLADIAAGRKANEEWDGNAWLAELGRDEVTVRNKFRPVLQGSYPFDEVRRVADDYWHFLVSRASGQERQEAIEEWEDWNGYAHPRHADL